jgi:cobalt-zinc-cadmium efflux system protein
MLIGIQQAECKDGTSCACYSQYLQADKEQNSHKRRVLWVALGLLVGFVMAEVTVSFWSGSLSLLADAEHMLADVVALSLTLVATWLAQKPAIGRATFGHRRVEIMAAFLNGVGLLAIAAFIAWEAIQHLQNPEPVLGLPMLIGATIGLVVNGLNISLLHRHSQNDLNLRGAMLHMLTDAASSVGVLIAAVTVYIWHWPWIDALTGLLIAGLTCLSALPLLGESLEILLEYSPRHINPEKVKTALLSFEAVKAVDALNLWSVSSNQVWLCAALRVSATLTLQERDQLLRQLRTYLIETFSIQESILQMASSSSEPPVNLHPLFSQDLSSLVTWQIRQTDASVAISASTSNQD